jgi:hypothetical protein
MRRRSFLLVLVTMASGCAPIERWLAPEVVEIPPAVEPPPAYEQLFPRYAELCAVSQFRPRDGEIGGIPGHAVLYLKGACRDESAPYPQLELCDGANAGPDDPRHGVGISVNRWFENVNWMATPGRDLFFDGDLDPGERLDAAHVDATAAKLEALGLYRGITLREYPVKPGETRSLADFIRHRSLGTDNAIAFGRTALCSRVPITHAMLEEIVDFLNDLNDEYASGAAEYEWSGYADNCVHAVRNALAAASVWRPKSVRAIKLRQLFNIAIPADEFVELAQRSTSFPVDDFDAVYADDEARRALLAFDWLPAPPGALVSLRTVFPDNDVYDTNFRLLALRRSVHHEVYEDARSILADPRFTDLETNLRHHQALYQHALADRAEAPAGFGLRGDRMRTVRRRYVKHMGERLAEVEGMLAQLESEPATEEATQ